METKLLHQDSELRRKPIPLDDLSFDAIYINILCWVHLVDQHEGAVVR